MMPILIIWMSSCKNVGENHSCYKEYGASKPDKNMAYWDNLAFLEIGLQLSLSNADVTINFCK